jgi:hypothetical protein
MSKVDKSRICTCDLPMLHTVGYCESYRCAVGKDCVLVVKNLTDEVVKVVGKSGVETLREDGGCD